jgi:hypothetical protein
MKYYYDPKSSGSNIGTDDLRELLTPKAQSLAIEIRRALYKGINFYWTRRDTLGFVFADFDFETETGNYTRLIGKGEKDIFESIRDSYCCLVVSKTLEKNFRIFKLGTEFGIAVNLNYFKDFMNVIRDSKNTVRLFLYKFKTQQQEELIRGWLKNYASFDEISKESLIDNIDSMIDIINKHKITNANDLDKLITIARAAGGQIQSNYEFFENNLNAFKTLIDSNTDETKVRDFLFNQLWILDFQYMSYSKKKEEKVPIGDIDISLLNDELGIQRAVIVELKRPSKQTLSYNYRGEDKPVIVSEVGKAISQTIHYLEMKKSPYRNLRGIVIIGRKGELKDEFLKTFNAYLHGIEVLTYDDIYERAREVINLFKTNRESLII